ncbi:MAG: hypothetical protein IJ583_02420 [Firmicutes bacterium]|nr:hypothetical protein [Bacillota bacterium]
MSDEKRKRSSEKRINNSEKGGRTSLRFDDEPKVSRNTEIRKRESQSRRKHNKKMKKSKSSFSAAFF